MMQDELFADATSTGAPEPDNEPPGRPDGGAPPAGRNPIDSFSSFAGRLTETVRARPITALAVAFVAGMTLSAMTRRT